MIKETLDTLDQIHQSIHWYVDLCRKSPSIHDKDFIVESILLDFGLPDSINMIDVLELFIEEEL